MTPGIIPYSLIPNPVPEGLYKAVQTALSSAGFPSTVFASPAGYEVSDVSTAQTAINAFVGSASELQHWQAIAQAQLDAYFDTHFDLRALIRAGTLTTVTAANVGSFIAQFTNNYRALRANISAATTVAQLQTQIQAITTGWPSNP